MGNTASDAASEASSSEASSSDASSSDASSLDESSDVTFEVINTPKAHVTSLLKKKPGDLSEDNYEQIYKLLSLRPVPDNFILRHFSCQGLCSITAIMFVPDSALKYDDFKDVLLKVYTSEGLLMQTDTSILPSYLDFINGIVYNHKALPSDAMARVKYLKTMRKLLVNECLTMFEELVKGDNETWQTFWDNFGFSIKLGICQDFANRSRLQELLQFESTEEELSTLGSYLKRMPEEQDTIFFMTGDSVDLIRDNANVGRLEDQNFEVFYMTDPIDEFVVSHIKSYQGKVFQCATLFDSISYTVRDKDAADNDFKRLVGFMKHVLVGKVDDVIVSQRLSHYPTNIVVKDSKKNRTSRTEHLIDSNTSLCRGECQPSQTILEINPNNDIIIRLKDNLENIEKSKKRKGKKKKKQAKDDMQILAQVVRLLLLTAYLAAGVSLNNVSTYQNTVIAFATTVYK